MLQIKQKRWSDEGIKAEIHVEEPEITDVALYRLTLSYTVAQKWFQEKI